MKIFTFENLEEKFSEEKNVQGETAREGHSVCVFISFFPPTCQTPRAKVTAGQQNVGKNNRTVFMQVGVETTPKTQKLSVLHLC